MDAVVRRGRSNWSTWIIWSLAGLTTLLPLTLSFLAPQISSESDLVGSVAFLMVAPVYGITGALIVVRQRRNSVGRMLMVIAMGITVGVVWALLEPSRPPVSLGIAQMLFWVFGSLSWMFFIFPIFHMLLTFPTGRLLSRRWRLFVGMEVGMISFLLLTGVFAEVVESPTGRWRVANPIGFIPESIFGDLFFTIWNACLLILAVASLAAVVMRFHRSAGVERQQMKWLLFAAGLFALVYGSAALLSGAENSAVIDVLLPVSMIGIGVAIAIAILRYRLFEIDRIISRTVTYTLVIGCLAAGVALVAAVVGTRFESPLVVAGTTLGVAAVFNPMRIRLQKLVDRRFNRTRYDHERIAQGFAASLRDRVDPDQIVAGWTGVVLQTMGPRSMAVWTKLS